MDFYRALNIDEGASPVQIERAYLRAREALPAPRRWWLDLPCLRSWRRHRLAQAYAVLRDPAARRAYQQECAVMEMLGRCPPGLF